MNKENLHPYLSVTLLTPEASHRRYSRVVVEKQNFILCHEPDPIKKDHHFLKYQQLWQAHGLRVPQVLAVHSDLGLIFQEDLGDVSLNSYILSCQQEKSVTERKALSFKIVKDLIQIQSLPQQEFPLVFDRSKLGFEWGWTWQHLIEPHLPILLEQVALLPDSSLKSEAILAPDSHCDSSLSEDNNLNHKNLKHEDIRNEKTKVDKLKVENFYKKWYEVTLQNAKDLEKEALVPTHRDFHSRNIMIVAGEPVYIDFQDGRLGTIYYDLVSLIYDSYLPFDKDLESFLIESYLKESEREREWDESLYFKQVIQRTLKAAGSFASFMHIKKDFRYQSYIGPTLTLALSAIERSGLQEYAFLKELLISLVQIYSSPQKNHIHEVQK
jgi:N-acetylmuramate 1-kinase